MDSENKEDTESVVDRLLNLKKIFPRDKNKRLVVLIIALLALPITLVLVQRVVRYFTGAASATIYFEPLSADLPPDTTLRLMVNSGSTKVGFARVEIDFDKTKVWLTSEVSYNDKLAMNNADVTDPGSLPQYACTGTEKCIIKTPMNAANNTGKIILVLAKDPRDAQIAPSGTFELARFTFTEITAAQTSTLVSVASNQLVDLESYKFNVSVQNANLALNGRAPTPTTPAGSIISSLQVNDSEVWSVMTNLQVGDKQYSDRNFTFTSVPSNVRGASWIQTANDSRYYTGTTIATFSLTEDATVYIAHDDRISSKPSWLSGWSDSGMNLVNNESTPKTFSLFSKGYSAGQTVNVGQNGGSSYGMYTVVAVGTGGVATNTPTQTPTETASPTPGECSSLYGDVSGDGEIVDIEDIFAIVLVFYTPPAENPCANVNGDDVIDIEDIYQVVLNFSY